MKVLNLIICLLAVTVFVACSKKKDGGSQPYGYGHNPYGLTTNEIYGNGYNSNPYQGYYPSNPGYPIPQGCQANQMFPDLLSYCGWLARDGAGFCQNPYAVKQAFLQYCQNYAVQFNYCVPQVRTGCFYTTGGCFGGQVGYTKPFRYKDTKRDSSLGKDVVEDGDGDYIPPVDPTPAPAPSPGNTYDCTNVNRDCKNRNVNKKGSSNNLICKLPNASDSETNYTYTVEEYRVLAPYNCPQSTRPVSDRVTELDRVIVKGERDNTPVYRPPVAAPQQQVTCTTEEGEPWNDCRLKRADNRSAVRGTTRRALKDFDFNKDSSGKTPFEREVQRGNIECKAKGATRHSRNYNMTYFEYVESLKKCGTVAVGTEQPIQSVGRTSGVVSTAPISSNEGAVAQQPLNSADEVAAAPVATKPTVNVDKCLDLEEMHKFILDPVNEYSSHQLFVDRDLVNKSVSSKFKTTWVEAVATHDNEYRGSIVGKNNQNTTAIGIDVQQDARRIKIDNRKGYGTIEVCRDDYMVANFPDVGQRLVVTWNKQLDDNMSMIYTWRGNFKNRNESSDYVINKFISIEKGNTSREKVHRNTVDKAERLGLIVQPQ